MKEIEQMIALHDEAKKKLVRRQFANELTDAITKMIITANNVVEYTAKPELASYNRALQEVLELLNPTCEEDPNRVAAAVQMGFIHERQSNNPYME